MPQVDAHPSRAHDGHRGPQAVVPQGAVRKGPQCGEEQDLPQSVEGQDDAGRSEVGQFGVGSHTDQGTGVGADSCQCQRRCDCRSTAEHENGGPHLSQAGEVVTDLMHQAPHQQQVEPADGVGAAADADHVHRGHRGEPQRGRHERVRDPSDRQRDGRHDEQVDTGEPQQLRQERTGTANERGHPGEREQQQGPHPRVHQYRCHQSQCSDSEEGRPSVGSEGGGVGYRSGSEEQRQHLEQPGQHHQARFDLQDIGGST